MTTRRTARRVVLLAVSALTAMATATACSSTYAETESALDPGAAARVAPVTDIDTAAADLLRRRAEAVASGDEAAWESTVRPTDPALLARERQAFAGTQALPLAEWAPVVVEARPAGQGGARVTAETSYRLDGDDRSSRVRTVLDLVPGIGGLVVAGSSSTPTPPWEVPGIHAQAGERSLVLGDVGGETLAAYAEQADAASMAVADLAPDEAPPRLSLLVLRSWQQARLLVGGGAASTGLAALTTRLEAPGVTAGPPRVLVNHSVLSALDRSTRGAVLAHEAFHVAAGDLGAVPLWLSEGLADYAGYRGSGVPLDRAVSGFLNAVRRDGPPAALPDDAAFEPGPAATSAYEGAHLAVRMLVDRHGEEAVLRAYRRVVATGADNVDAVLREELGVGIGEVTADWQATARRRAAD